MSVQFPWSQRPTCRICGRPMSMEVVRYSAPDAEGQRRTWEGVRRYYCPDGCSTGFYDFKRARVRAPAGAASGSRMSLQAAGWGLAHLFTAAGLAALYALFMYGVSRMPIASPWVRVLVWLLVTAGAAGVVALLAFPPRPSSRPAAGEVAAGERAAEATTARAPAAAEPKPPGPGTAATPAGRTAATPGRQA